MCLLKQLCDILWGFFFFPALSGKQTKQNKTKQNKTKHLPDAVLPTLQARSLKPGFPVYVVPDSTAPLCLEVIGEKAGGRPSGVLCLGKSNKVGSTGQLVDGVS